MFDGSFKRRRAVNLGGNRGSSSGKIKPGASNLDSKKDFLSRARKERHERENKRQRDDAIIVLQRWIRKVISCIKLRKSTYDEWISKIQDIEKMNLLIGESLPLPTALVAHFVRQFNVRLFCYRISLTYHFYRHFLRVKCIGSSFQRCVALLSQVPKIW